MTHDRDDPEHRQHPDRKGALRDALPSKPLAGLLIGGLLGGIEQVVTGRPRPPAQIEEPYQDEWATIDGVTVEGLDEARERAEPPDRSGARV